MEYSEYLNRYLNILLATRILKKSDFYLCIFLPKMSAL